MSQSIGIHKMNKQPLDWNPDEWMATREDFLVGPVYVGRKRRWHYKADGHSYVETTIHVVTGDDESELPMFSVGEYAVEYDWGYRGSGPSATALSLLAHHFGETPNEHARIQSRRTNRTLYSMLYYQAFRNDIVARIPRWVDTWTLPCRLLVAWVDAYREEGRGGRPNPYKQTG